MGFSPPERAVFVGSGLSVNGCLDCAAGYNTISNGFGRVDNEINLTIIWSTLKRG